MRVSLLTVGRPRQGAIAQAIDEYETRAARYWTFEAVEVKEESARNTTPTQVKHREAERLLSRIAADTQVVACDPGGDTMTSEAFATWLGAYRDRAQDVAFIVGGAYGLGDAVRTRANKCIALAPFTLPHELARLVLVEQLYRAGTINRGEPYHK